MSTHEIVEESPSVEGENSPAEEESPPTDSENLPADEESTTANEENPPGDGESPPDDTAVPPGDGEIPLSSEESPPDKEEISPVEQKMSTDEKIEEAATEGLDAEPQEQAAEGEKAEDAEILGLGEGDEDVKPPEAEITFEIEVSTGQESESVEFGHDDGKLDKEITAADEAEKEVGEETEPTEETPELLEGEKMLAEIDPMKVREEADTEIEDVERPIVPEHGISQLSLHDEDLPDIRGLAELEYESNEDSLKEVTFGDEMFASKRKSVRASLAIKLLSESEEFLDKKKGKGRREMLARAIKKAAFDEEKALREQKEKAPPPTREEYYALHEIIMSDFNYIRIKNKFLQRKMADYFKKRKMEHVLKEEPDVQTDAVQKYEKKLDRLADLFDVFNAETKRIGDELDILQKDKDDKVEEKKAVFLKGITREREIGIGLISTKTGKEIPDKVVEQLIRRQVNASKQISDLRLKFISKRDELAEKSAELRSLDNIGEDLSLMDYEQLKIENRALSDKLEEREEELTKLRVKCRNAVQIMAHVREKSAALDADMDILKEEYEEVHSQYIEIRERLNFYKTERDVIRNKTMKMKAESGLLTKPKLLFDMETSIAESKVYGETLEGVKNEYNFKTQQIRNLRKNIAFEILMNKKPHKERKKFTESKFHQTRPTLIIPKLPKNIFHKLENAIPGSEEKD